MGFFSKLFKGPEIDLEKSAANAARMRELFDAVVPEGSTSANSWSTASRLRLSWMG